MCSGMCCLKNMIVLIVVLQLVLNIPLLAQCRRVKRVIGGTDVDCGMALYYLVFRY